MISENRGGIATDPAVMLVPAALLGALTVGINLFCDAMAGGEK